MIGNKYRLKLVTLRTFQSCVLKTCDGVWCGAVARSWDQFNHHKSLCGEEGGAYCFVERCLRLHNQYKATIGSKTTFLAGEG